MYHKLHINETNKDPEIEGLYHITMTPRPLLITVSLAWQSIELNISEFLENSKEGERGGLELFILQSRWSRYYGLDKYKVALQTIEDKEREIKELKERVGSKEGDVTHLGLEVGC